MIRVQGLRRTKAGFFLAFAFVALGRAASEGGAAATYIVAVADLSATGLPPSMGLFVSSFPRLLLAELSALPPHYEDNAYRGELAFLGSSRSMYSHGADLAARLDDLALRALEPGIDPAKRLQNLAEARAKIDAAEGDLEEVLAGSGQDVKVSPTGPVETGLSSLNNKGQLVPLLPGGPLATIKGKDVDLLVYGKVEAIGSYVAVEVRAFDANLGRDVFAIRTHADPADPAPLARDIGRRLCVFIAGRPYARLELTVTPDMATVKVNGRDLDATTRRLFLFEKSALLIVASAPGRNSVAANVELDVGEAKEVSFDLPLSSSGSATISTLPAGLPVYIDGMFAGLSPITAGLQGERSIVTTQTPEGEKAMVILPPSGNPVIILEPDSSAKDAAALVDKRRDAFYDALGFFVLSLPATSLSYGLQTTFADAYIRGSEESMLGKYEAATISLGVCGAASLGLLVNVAIQLVRYIGAAK